jgi:hypothetical protein
MKGNQDTSGLELGIITMENFLETTNRFIKEEKNIQQLKEGLELMINELKRIRGEMI